MSSDKLSYNRRLDIAVAKEVMGYSLETRTSSKNIKNPSEEWFVPHILCDSGVLKTLPRYSSDWNSTIEAVQKVEEITGVNVSVDVSSSEMTCQAALSVIRHFNRTA